MDLFATYAYTRMEMSRIRESELKMLMLLAHYLFTRR